MIVLFFDIVLLLIVINLNYVMFNTVINTYFDFCIFLYLIFCIFILPVILFGSGEKSHIAPIGKSQFLTNEKNQNYPNQTSFLE